MSNSDPTVIIRLGPDDWQIFKEIRLEALREAPEAFASTLAEATLLKEAAWRSRLNTRAQFLASIGPTAVGTAGGILTEAGPELISMWVDPRFRRSGIGAKLVDAVVEWASPQPFDSIVLWVAPGNQAAERLYRGRGFRRTGVSQPMAEGKNDRCEFAMSRPLDRIQAPGR